VFSIMSQTVPAHVPRPWMTGLRIIVAVSPAIPPYHIGQHNACAAKNHNTALKRDVDRLDLV